ncbi:MAG: hypothetical protein RL326_2216, partial [Pseudomonadota bacterium]
QALQGKENLIESLARECVARTKTPIEAVEQLVQRAVQS